MCLSKLPLDTEAHRFPRFFRSLAQCKYWTPALLAPAESACHLQCTGISPPGPAPKLACDTDADCTDPSKPTCVVQADKTWAQCVSCDDKPFQNSCESWEKKKFLPAAEKKCGKMLFAFSLGVAFAVDPDTEHRICLP